MKYSSKNRFPDLLTCKICFYPPYKPRISKCQCDFLFCFQCVRNQKNTKWCTICRWKVEYQQLPETYKYILENIQIKCQICQEYKPALTFKKHKIQCQKKKQLFENQQRWLIIEHLKIQNQPQNISEMDLNELSNINYTCNYCLKQFDGIDILSHFYVCEQLIISCEMENCEWTGTRINYNNHLKLCCKNQISKRETEINLLEQSDFILSRNKSIIFSESIVMLKKAISLRLLNQYNQYPNRTPQRNTCISSVQSYLYSLQVG